MSWDLRYQLVNFSFLFEQKVHLVLVHQGILLSGSFHPRLCFIASSYFLLVLTFKIVMYILLDFYFIDITIFIRWFWNLNISLIRWLWICSCIWSQFMFLCNLIIFFINNVIWLYREIYIIFQCKKYCSFISFYRTVFIKQNLASEACISIWE